MARRACLLAAAAAALAAAADDDGDIRQRLFPTQRGAVDQVEGVPPDLGALATARARGLAFLNQQNLNVITAPRACRVRAGGRGGKERRAWRQPRLTPHPYHHLLHHAGVSLLFVGDRWDGYSKTAVRDFIDGLGASDWWGISRLYSGPSGAVPASVVRDGDATIPTSFAKTVPGVKVVSPGNAPGSLNITSVKGFVSAAVTAGKLVVAAPSAVHLVLVLADDRTTSPGHCTDHCGWHALGQADVRVVGGAAGWAGGGKRVRRANLPVPAVRPPRSRLLPLPPTPSPAPRVQVGGHKYYYSCVLLLLLLGRRRGADAAAHAPPSSQLSPPNSPTPPAPLRPPSSQLDRQPQVLPRLQGGHLVRRHGGPCPQLRRRLCRVPGRSH
jgi:hypothetical protein